jgi:hypothetical protein
MEEGSLVVNRFVGFVFGHFAFEFFDDGVWCLMVEL